MNNLEKMVEEAKLKVKIYKSLLESIEEHGEMFSVAIIEGRLYAEQTFIEITEGKNNEKAS
jgi:hypothetical protein